MIKLGKMISKVEEIETGPSGACFRKFLRVRITLDISKPLKRGLRVKLEGEEDLSTLPILYERLSTFCFQRCKIGHVFRECSEYKPSSRAEDFQHFKYGL